MAELIPAGTAMAPATDLIPGARIIHESKRIAKRTHFGYPINLRRLFTNQDCCKDEALTPDVWPGRLLSVVRGLKRTLWSGMGAPVG